jgi:bis(5'-nucleosidyl)-tetraphosphatase
MEPATLSEINERSFGVIPLQIRLNTPYIFIIQHYSGAWMFPKGHAEDGETEKQAAERELAEETGLSIERWLDHAPFVEHYFFYRGMKKVYKEARYFPALVKGSIRLQQAEVKGGKWERAANIPVCVTFAEMRHIAEQVNEWLLAVDFSL